MTGAVRMSLAATGKPAPPSAPAIDARGTGSGVGDQGQRDRGGAQPVQGRDRPGQRLPRDGQHAIDIDQHRAHAPTITQRHASPRHWQLPAGQA